MDDRYEGRGRDDRAAGPDVPWDPFATDAEQDGAWDRSRSPSRIQDQEPRTDPQRWPDDDDLDRAFGHGTASVGRRTTGQRVRSGSVVAVFVVVVAVAVGATLWVLIGNVRTGIGGIFPTPGAAAQRFDERAAEVDGVTDTEELDTSKTSFASYDVRILVTVAPDTSPSERRRIVASLSDIADESSGNGIHVYAEVRFGTLRVGVSPSAGRSQQRLQLAEDLATVPGVQRVTCDWEPRGDGVAIEDRGDGLRVAVVTSAAGSDLTAVQQATLERAGAALPGAGVVVQAPTAG